MTVLWFLGQGAVTPLLAFLAGAVVGAFLVAWLSDLRLYRRG